MFRGGNLEEFFSHENHAWPPALSNNRRLYLPTKKSDLLRKLIVGDPGQALLFYNAKIFDGAAIVHALPSHQVSTFGEYADHVFIRWIEQQLQNCNRVDIVCDIYKEDSIKESTREKRGKGIRRKVGEAVRSLPISRIFLRTQRTKKSFSAC